MNRRIGKPSRLLSAAIVSTLLASSAYAQQRTFDLPEQDAIKSIPEFARQAGIQISAPTEELKGMRTPRIEGELDVRAALEKLIEGTGLAVASDEGGMVILRKAESASSKQILGREEGNRMHLAWLESEDHAAPISASASDQQQRTQADERPTFSQERQEMRLEEVIVTGSHIRGAQNLSSPVITFNREDIEASGYSTTQQLLHSLPQNSNSISDTTLGNLNGGQANAYTYSGSGINLRGLGGDATLVLLNGRRMAAAGNGSFVDISLIPLGAIERIEVLTDGASALYGSDAVGGVVNLVLRKDFEGAETRLRYGAVTEGSHNEIQAAQTFGGSWSSGNALFTYDYMDRTALVGSDRSFYDPDLVYGDLDLIPKQKRQGAFAVLNQQLSDRVGISSNFFYGRRESGFRTNVPGIGLFRDYASEVQQYGGSIGLTVDLANDWQMRVSGLLDRTKSDQIESYEYAGVAQPTVYANGFRLSAVDVGADGSLFETAGGRVRLAVGGQMREESFSEDYFAYPTQLERDILSGYAEVLVPFVGEQSRRPGMERVELTLAGRYENYSDFGGTFNPKIGIAWAPLRGLNVRGTWGTSFKAPLLTQLNPGDRFLFLYESYFVDESGPTPAVLRWGNGENLGPEKSENWTAGFDFVPEALPDLSISATYFAIDYRDRVTVPFPSGYDQTRTLLDPTYARLITHEPDLAYVQELISNTRYVYCTTATSEDCDPYQFAGLMTAVIDARERNLAGVRMSGIDFTLSHNFRTGFGNFALHFGGSKLLRNLRQVMPGSGWESEINDVYFPVDLRLRSSLSWSRDGLNSVVAVNYVDGYRDTGRRYTGESIPRPTVASWTTVDFTLQYDLSRLWGQQSRTKLQLSAVNIFDRDPPYVANYYGLHFDGVNANPLGRFVSIQLTAAWGQ